MRSRDHDPDDEFTPCECRGGTREVTEVFARQEAGIPADDDLQQWERRAAAAAEQIREATAEAVRNGQPKPEQSNATLDTWQKFRALLNSVYPCPRCRPAQFQKWRNGCYRPGHVARRCKVCNAATEAVRR